jgi:hypothetical protein
LSDAEQALGDFQSSEEVASAKADFQSAHDSGNVSPGIGGDKAEEAIAAIEKGEYGKAAFLGREMNRIAGADISSSTIKTMEQGSKLTTKVEKAASKVRWTQKALS